MHVIFCLSDVKSTTILRRTEATCYQYFGSTYTYVQLRERHIGLFVCVGKRVRHQKDETTVISNSSV
jgi:hypothetical protein